MKYNIVVSTGVSCTNSSKTTMIPMMSAVRSSSASLNQTSSLSPTRTATTPPSTSASTMQTTSPITTPAPTTHGRQFDGASFAGGIILGVVLTVIFIFAFKWWQARNKSYHSL